MVTPAIDLESLRHVARLAGFAWSDAELEAIRPMVTAMLGALASLEALPLGAVEPAVQFRIL